MSGALAQGRAVVARLTPGRGAVLAARHDALVPGFAESLTEWASGRHYARPGPDLRTRQLCTVAAPRVRGGQTGRQLRVNVDLAPASGATRGEVIEAIWQMAVHGGPRRPAGGDHRAERGAGSLCGSGWGRRCQRARSATRSRMKASPASNSLTSRYSSGWWAWAMSPGPQTTAE